MTINPNQSGAQTLSIAVSSPAWGRALLVIRGRQSSSIAGLSFRDMLRVHHGYCNNVLDEAAATTT